MSPRTICLVLLALTAIAGCAAHRPPAAGAAYLVVRHAEKGSDDPSDPSLSAAGQARAAALARQLSATPLAAAYATAYKRTQQTALPAATAGRIAITTYDASGSAADFAAGLRRLHPQGVVLVVGHSNTVPAIVAALCGCSVTPMDENDYGRLYEVRLDNAGRATLAERKY